MVNVKTEILIDCPIEQVAEYASNPENAPEWTMNIKFVEWKTAKPLTTGSQISFKVEFLGRKLAYTYEFVELIAGKKLVMKTSEGPFPMETTYTWESIDNGTTRMTLQNKGVPKGFSKYLAPFMVFAMKRANKKDLKLLKEILEK